MAVPVVVSALVGGLVSALGTMTGKVLASIGIGYVIYAGVDAAIDFLQARVMSELALLPPDLVAILGLLKVGTCLNIMFSSYVAQVAIRAGGDAAGNIRRMVLKS